MRCLNQTYLPSLKDPNFNKNENINPPTILYFSYYAEYFTLDKPSGKCLTYSILWSPYIPPILSNKGFFY